MVVRRKAMNKRRDSAARLLLLPVLLALLAWGCALNAPRISKHDLKARLGNPQVVVIDTRLPYDWTAGEGKIAGSVREDPGNVDSWASKYSKDKTIVTYCA